MHGGAKVAIVDLAHSGHETVAQQGNFACTSVGLRLRNIARTRDHRADTRLLSNPRQRHLRGREVGNGRLTSNKSSELVNRSNAGLEVDAREGLPHVERFAATVIRAVIVFGEGGVDGVLATEQARGQWNSCNYSYACI